MEILVKYRRDDSPRLQIIEKGDWIDLYLDEDVNLNMFEFGLFDLGVAIKLEDGYEAILAPRSSTFKKYGVIMPNSIGVIDNSYSGNDDFWKIPLLSLSKDPIHIEKGSRVCQFRILKSQKHLTSEDNSLVLSEVSDLGPSQNRGGFGTTGN